MNTLNVRCPSCGHTFHNIRLRRTCPNCGKSLTIGAGDTHHERDARADLSDGFDVTGFAPGGYRDRPVDHPNQPPIPATGDPDGPRDTPSPIPSGPPDPPAPAIPEAPAQPSYTAPDASPVDTGGSAAP